MGRLKDYPVFFQRSRPAGVHSKQWAQIQAR